MSVRLSNQGDKTIERARNPLRFTFNQSSDTNTHTPSDGLSFFPFYVISSGLFLIGAMDGWMDDRREKSFLHTREIWHNYPNCVRRCERDPIVPLPICLSHTHVAGVKDHLRNQRSSTKSKKKCGRSSNGQCSVLKDSSLRNRDRGKKTRSHTESIIARREATINRAPVSCRERRRGRGDSRYSLPSFLSSSFYFFILTGRSSLRPAGYKNNKPIQVHQILSCFSSNSRFYDDA